MQALEEAHAARSKKSNKIEGLKALKTPISVLQELEAICKAGYENLADEDSKFFLKCFGLFDKGEGEFMMRLRIPGGQLGVDQARVIGTIAKAYGNDYIDITTRQQIELRFIPFEALYKVLKSLDDVGISTYQTGVDNFRNIVTSAFDGYAKNSYVACMPIIEELQSIFLKKEEWIGLLPRKFNTAILGCGINDCNIFGHDCCFIPAKKGELFGFNLYLGGKVGVQAQESGLFVLPHEVSGVYRALITLFKRYGFRDNRNKNRLHFLIEAVGMERFAASLCQESGLDLQSSGELLLEAEHQMDAKGVMALAKGKSALLFSIPSGVFNGSDMVEAAEVAERYGGELRLSVEQSFYIIADDAAIIALKSEALYEKYAGYQNPYFMHQIACAGTATCSFGVIPNKPDAIEMAEYLAKEVPLENAKIRMYWSACPKGCGIHGIADIGFEGCKAKDAQGNTCYGVHILLGGKASFEAKEARVIYKALPLDVAREKVRALVSIYRDERLEGETFEAFDSRTLQYMATDRLQAKIDTYLVS